MGAEKKKCKKNAFFIRTRIKLREMNEERMVSGLMDTALREAELAVRIPPKGKSKRRYYS